MFIHNQGLSIVHHLFLCRLHAQLSYVLHFPENTHAVTIVGFGLNGVVFPGQHYVVRREHSHLVFYDILQNQETVVFVEDQVAQFIAHIDFKSEILLYDSRNLGCF